MSEGQSGTASRYLTPREVAQMLRKSLSWVHKMTAAGLLPHRKFGKDLRFIPREIDAWAEKQPGVH